jgi:hypothetical protein
MTDLRTKKRKAIERISEIAEKHILLLIPSLFAALMVLIFYGKSKKALSFALAIIFLFSIIPTSGIGFGIFKTSAEIYDDGVDLDDLITINEIIYDSSVGIDVTLTPAFMPFSSGILSGDYWYEDNGNGTATIIEYIGSDINVVIPSTIDGMVVTRIDGAFRDNTNVISVLIPDNVSSIMSASFWGTTSLTSINVNSTNTWLSSDNGILFAEANTVLVVYPAGKPEASYTVPNSVTRIFNGAFFGAANLTSIILHDDIETIDANGSIVGRS